MTNGWIVVGVVAYAAIGFAFAVAHAVWMETAKDDIEASRDLPPPPPALMGLAWPFVAVVVLIAVAAVAVDCSAKWCGRQLLRVLPWRERD